MSHRCSPSPPVRQAAPERTPKLPFPAPRPTTHSGNAGLRGMGVPHPQTQPPGWALSIYQALPDYTTIVFQAHKPQREMRSPPDCSAKETGSPTVPVGAVRGQWSPQTFCLPAISQRAARPEHRPAGSCLPLLHCPQRPRRGLCHPEALDDSVEPPHPSFTLPPTPHPRHPSFTTPPTCS